jgi:hypothetical protein
MAFTIQLFCPDNDPTGTIIIERINWTGVGAVFPKEHWRKIAERTDFKAECVYVLIGHQVDGQEEVPKIYVGQTSDLGERFKTHLGDKNKEFWERTLVYSSSKCLNKAHVLWLEQKLIERARDAGRCIVENGNEPRSPDLSESDCSDITEFLKQMLETLPVVGIHVFQKGKTFHPNTPALNSNDRDVPKQADEMVIVVPAQEDGFQRVFLGENSWYAIRIATEKIDKIRYIAAYQTSPISAVTHFAPVKEIVPHGDEGKYKLTFSSPAKELKNRITFSGRPGSMQSTRYTTLKKLLSAKATDDLE